MATETSCSGPGLDCGFVTDEANPGVEPELSGKSVTEDIPEMPVESLQSPPTAADKKIRFSISSILDNDDDDDDAKPPAESDGPGSAALAAETGSPAPDNKGDHPSQLTFFYRDQLRCSLQKTQSSSDVESGRSADAQISSWTVPPTSPFLYRESSSCSYVGVSE